MFRLAAKRVQSVTATAIQHKLVPRAMVACRWSHGKKESDEAFDARWEAYFSRPEIDDWELRRGMNELYGHDLVPEPKVLNAALRACRRLDDFAMSVRIFELVKDKSCGDKEIYNYVLQQCKETMDELGVSSPEELGLA